MAFDFKDPLRIIFSLLLFSLHSQITFAGEGSSPEPSWKQEAVDHLKSPLSTDAKYSLLVGAGLVGGLLLFEDQIIDPLQAQATRDKPLGSYSKYGDLAGKGIPNAAYIAGMFTYNLLKPESKTSKNALAMLESTAYSVAVTTALKYTVREQRPSNPNNRTSFPSGHTTTAFAFASYVGCRHSLPWGIAAYTMAAFVGMSRINDNAHYLHDVVAGAAIGESYGLGICLAENKAAETLKEKSKTSWQLVPVSGGLMAGLTWIY